MARAAGFLLAAALAGCAVGPSYRRPPVDVPETTRTERGPADATSLADQPWWAVFRDPALQALVEDAIHGSHDLRAAAARVEQARNRIAIARADVFPQLTYQAQAERAREFIGFPGAANQTFNAFLATFNLAWEIDVWGRIRRATESARADYLAAEAARRGVLLTLVSDVAQAYFELVELDHELEITQGTTLTFQDTLDLFRRRYAGGIGTLLEVSRATAALTQARAGIPELERQIVAKENQISVLLGRRPDYVRRGRPDDESLPPDVPVGLPSQLLERRPDVQEAEQAIVAANADVGVTVANFFPRIGLTGLYGGESSELENIVKSGGNVWAIAGSLAGPIFQGGRLLASYRATSAAWNEAVERYEQTTLRAFAEVSDALVAHENLKGVRAEREETVKALQTSTALSLQRYNDGIASYFEVLEAEQQLFPAELDLARTVRDERVAVISLYRALGGGWNLAVPDWGAPPVGPTARRDADAVEAARP